LTDSQLAWEPCGHPLYKITTSVRPSEAFRLRSISADASLPACLPSVIFSLPSLPAYSSVAGITSPIQQTLADTASALRLTDGSHRNVPRAYKSVHNAKLCLNAQLRCSIKAPVWAVLLWVHANMINQLAPFCVSLEFSAPMSSIYLLQGSLFHLSL
jgi:hypothetical protein